MHEAMGFTNYSAVRIQSIQLNVVKIMGDGHVVYSCFPHHPSLLPTGSTTTTEECETRFCSGTAKEGPQ